MTPPRSLSPVQAQLRAEAPCWETPRALVSGIRVPRAEPRAGRSEDGGPTEACRRHPEAEPAARLRVGAEGRQRHVRGRLQGEAPTRPASVGRPRDAPDHSVRPGSGPDPAAPFRAPRVPHLFYCYRPADLTAHYKPRLSFFVVLRRIYGIEVTLKIVLVLMWGEMLRGRQ